MGFTPKLKVITDFFSLTCSLPNSFFFFFFNIIYNKNGCFNVTAGERKIIFIIIIFLERSHLKVQTLNVTLVHME